MTDVILIYKATAKVISNFWLPFVILIVGLAYISHDESKKKNKNKGDLKYGDSSRFKRFNKIR